MSVVAIIQARMGSSRLPGKVLEPLAGKSMLWHIVNRVRRAAGVDRVVVATSQLPVNDPVRELCAREGIACFSGSEDDVLDRFYRAAREHGGDPLIRITGDCPFADPGVIERLVAMYRGGSFDHVGVATGAGALFMDQGRFPDGLDAECFSFAALERAFNEALPGPDREHVTPYIWRNKDKFRCGALMSDTDYSTLRWTVDNQADLDLVRRVYEGLYREETPFRMNDILAFLAANPELAALNRDYLGQEGYAEIWQGVKG